MHLDATSSVAASSIPARKITRKETATFSGLSIRTIDELTRNGILPHYKIGKSVRYELAEVEAALRERFHVKAKAKKAA